MIYDPDSPIQDADIESAELHAEANRQARLKRKGICLHNWIKAPPGQPAVCLDCGKSFPTEAELNEERRELLI